MSLHLSRNERRAAKRHAARFPDRLTLVPRSCWPVDDDERRFAVWASNQYLVQGFNEKSGVRLSVNRTAIRSDGNWEDGLSWDELQTIKRHCGYGTRLALEVYPPDIDVVTVANMRHLWIPDEPPDIGWRRSEAAGSAHV